MAVNSREKTKEGIGPPGGFFLPDIKRKDMDSFAAVGSVGCETYFSKPFPYRQAVQPLVMIGHRERLGVAVFVNKGEGKGALIEEGCIIDQDDSDHDMMEDLRIGRETLPSLL